MRRSRPHPCRTIWLAGICGLLSSDLVAGAERHLLRSGAVPGDLTKVQVQIEVGGELKVVAEGKVKPLQMSVAGKLVYEEKSLEPGEGRGTAAARSVRYYDQAEATIKIEDGGEKPKLRGDRRLIVVDGGASQTVLFSPQGPLVREELDLLDVPGNTLWLENLLPAKPVAVGDRWRHGDQLLASLLGLDAVSQADVNSELKSIDADNARFELAGEIHGAVGGVATDISFKAKYRFDRKQRRIAWIGMLIKEKRSVGHVATGLDVVAKMQVSLAPLAESRRLSGELLNSLALDAAARSVALECLAPAGKFRFQHGRGWHVMSDAGEVLTMRYVDRGELVAQCNVSSLADVDEGKIPTLAKFQQDIEKALDKNFGQFIQASESMNSSGHAVYRVVAEGKVSELPIQWRYYLVADGKGRQAVFAYTLESELARQLGDADQELVSSVQFIDRPGATAGQPTPAKTPPKVGKKPRRNPPDRG
jgi:hypothetical protein